MSCGDRLSALRGGCFFMQPEPAVIGTYLDRPLSCVLLLVMSLVLIAYGLTIVGHRG